MPNGTLKSRTLGVINVKMTSQGLNVAVLIVLGAFGAVAEKEHVHFKIHVPEIIKHHIHTHTVFIHVHHPPKKKKKPEAQHEDHHDWSIYNSYDAHSGYEEEYSSKGGDNGLDRVTPQYPALVHKGRGQAEPPFYDDYKANYGTPGAGRKLGTVKTKFANGVVGYSYPPQYGGQYQVTEHVDETPVTYPPVPVAYPPISGPTPAPYPPATQYPPVIIHRPVPVSYHTTYDHHLSTGKDVEHGKNSDEEIKSFYHNKIEDGSNSDESSEEDKKQLTRAYFAKRRP